MTPGARLGGSERPGEARDLHTPGFASRGAAGPRQASRWRHRTARRIGSAVASEASQCRTDARPTRRPEPGHPPRNLAKELGSSRPGRPGRRARHPQPGLRSARPDPRRAPPASAAKPTAAPESDYPTSNYGFDVFISTGVTHPIGDFTAAFVTILNGIWLGLIFVLKLILELLGLAFGLNPFADGATMSRISASIGRVYDAAHRTLALGAGRLRRHLVRLPRPDLRRDLAGSVAGTLAAIAMLVLGLWVVHQPRESVGRLAAPLRTKSPSAAIAPRSRAASTARSAPTPKRCRRPGSRLVEVPFAGLDFSDVSWALSRPPPEAVKTADDCFCEDIGALAHDRRLRTTSASDRPKKNAPPSPASATASRAG